jgi:hypothetical protein
MGVHGKDGTMTVKSTAIWNEVIRLLTAAQAAGQPLEFVNKIYQGEKDRTDVPDSLLPVIIVDPMETDEVKITIPHGLQPTDRIFIICWMRAYGKDTQVTGDDGISIQDFANTVKNVINAEPNLNAAGNVIYIGFPHTVYVLDSKDWPYRQAGITLEVTYRAQDTNR